MLVRERECWKSYSKKKLKNTRDNGDFVLNEIDILTGNGCVSAMKDLPCVVKPLSAYNI